MALLFANVSILISHQYQLYNEKGYWSRYGKVR